MTIKEMADARAKAIAHNQGLLDKATNENRSLTEDETTQFDAADAEIKKYNDLMKRSASVAEHVAQSDAELPRAIKGDVLRSKDEVDGFIKDKESDIGRRTGKLQGFESKESAYRCGQWVAATLFGNPKSRQWCDSHGMKIQAAMSESVNSAGGILVPDEMERAIIDLVQQFGVYRQNARVRTMTSDLLTVPRKLTRLTAYPVAEGGTGTTSQATFDAIQLSAKSWQVETRYSSELADDAIIDVAQDIALDCAKAFAYAEDSVGFNGTGISTDAGILGLKGKINDGNHAASIVTGITGHTAFSTLALADFYAMIGALPEFPGAQPKWFISKTGYAASMLNVLMGLGGVQLTEGADGNRTMSFLGYPIVFTQVMNSTTTAQTSATGACYFGDLSLSGTLGDRRGITMASNPYLYMYNRQVAVYGWNRWDIVNHEAGSATPTGSPVMSMICLNFPGS
jgi:HK97 family phage major capsid protein